MSDEQERPLSRRELREREGWQAQDVEADSPVAHTPEFDQALVAESVPVTTTSSIPVIGPDGRIMTRRELRELWAAEEAAAAAADKPEEADVAAEADVAEAPTEAENPAEAEGTATAEAEAKSDTEGSPTTSADSDIELDTAADRDAEVVDETETEHEPLPAPEHKGFRFPWSKKTAVDEDVNDDESGLASGAGTVAAATAATAALVTGGANAETQVDADADAEAQAETEADTRADEEHLPEAQGELETQPDGESSPEPEAAVETEIKTYSFPEVSPEPESRSIFDHQTTGTIGFVPTTEITDPSETGAFDDIITRAVADEGAASPTNTAALILPVLPDTADLSGAFNETGEIVITGSIELPKSLGETGGHLALHDTLDPHEAAVLGHDVHDVVVETQSNTQPVSATRAVSAQASNNAIVSPISKGDSKLPIILAISAGGLVVLVAAVFIWAASTGLFG